MTCPHGNHVAPRTGGPCACGLVTFHPAPAKPACPTCATPHAHRPDGAVVSPDDYNHITCCDDNRSLCGVDVTDEPWVPYEDTDCPRCVAVANDPCGEGCDW